MYLKKKEKEKKVTEPKQLQSMMDEALRLPCQHGVLPRPAAERELALDH